MAGCTHRTVTLYELHPPHASPHCRRHLHQVIYLWWVEPAARSASLRLQPATVGDGAACTCSNSHLQRAHPATCASAVDCTGRTGELLGGSNPLHAQAWRAAPAAGGSCCGSNPPRLRDPSLGYTCSRCAAQRAVVRARTVGVQHSSTRGILQPAGGEELFLVKPKSKLLSSVLNLVLRSVYGRISHAPRVPRLLAPKRL